MTQPELQEFAETIEFCKKEITQLRELDAVRLYETINRNGAFVNVLSLVEESFRPDHFQSVVSDDYLPVLEDDFMTYLLAVRHQLKKPVKWLIVVELDYKFSMLRMRHLIKHGFETDFVSYAIINIKLIDLWMQSID